MIVIMLIHELSFITLKSKTVNIFILILIYYIRICEVLIILIFEPQPKEIE